MDVRADLATIRFGVFEVDLRSGELRRSGVRVALQEQPFRALALLLEQHGQVVTREELQAALWSDDTFVDFDRGVNVAIARVREALGDDANRARFIETVPKRGYRFIAPIDRPRATSEPRDSRPAGLRRRPYVGIAIAVAVAAAGYVGVTYFRSSRQAAISGLDIRQITTTGDAGTGPALSSNGEYVAYVRQSGNTFSLWVRQISTASEIQIVPPSPDVTIGYPSISPDSRFIDFLRAPATVVEREVWRVPLVGGKPRKLLDQVFAPGGWSPDSRLLAFVRPSSQQSTALVITRDDGTGERVVSERQNPRRYLSFSVPAWSPDGRLIALFGEKNQGDLVRSELAVVDAATGGEHVIPLLFAPLGGSRGGGVQWLDDRTLVLNRTVEVGAPNQLWRLTYPDGQLSPLTNDSTDYTGVGLSGDRGSLVTLRTDVRVSLWLGGDDRGDMTEIVPPTAMSARTDLARVVWARDRLLHGSIVNGRATIAAVAPEHPTTDEMVAVGILPAATSDGRKVVFVSPETGDHSGLWRVDIDGRHLAHLVSGAVNSPVVTPDDRRVIFVSARTGLQSLWTVPIDGGPATQLANVFAYQPDVSTDGKRLLFGASPSTRGVLGACDLPACSNMKTIRTAPSGPISRWTPDGRGIVYRDGGRGFGDPGRNLWVQPLDESAPYQLTHFADDRAITDFAWSRDGSRLAVARATVTDDIVLFKGFRR